MMNVNKIIYFVIMKETLEDFKTHTVGWFVNVNDAIEFVKNNLLDIREDCYNYAIIEKSNEGVYNFNENSQIWFKYNNEKFKMIKMPKKFKNVLGLWM
jgi:hypothetical protein